MSVSIYVEGASSWITTLLSLFSNGDGILGSILLTLALSISLSIRFSANGLLKLSIPFNHIWSGVQLLSVCSWWLFYNSSNSFNTWLSFTRNKRRKACMSIGLSVVNNYPSSTVWKIWSNMWMTQPNTSLHIFSIGWFLVDEPAMKLFRFYPRFSATGSQISTFSTPYSTRILEAFIYGI